MLLFCNTILCLTDLLLASLDDILCCSTDEARQDVEVQLKELRRYCERVI